MRPPRGGPYRINRDAKNPSTTRLRMIEVLPRSNEVVALMKPGLLIAVEHLHVDDVLDLTVVAVGFMPACQEATPNWAPQTCDQPTMVRWTSQYKPSNFSMR
jgi:hypothetical protein